MTIIKRMKAAVLVVLALGVLASAAGCGGGDDGDSGSASGGAETPKLTGTITVWDDAYKSHPGYTRAADVVDAAFEKKHPGVKINRVSQVFEKYDQALQAAFTARKGPDLMRLASGAQGVLLWQKGLEKLNDRVTPEMREAMFGWNMATPDFTEDGDLYGVPTGAQGIVFYYNKKVFKQAGLPTEFQPSSWDEVIAAGKKLKAAGFDAFTGGNKEGYESRWWFDQGWVSTNTKEQALKLARGEMPWTDPAVAAAIRPHLQMSEAGLFRSDRFTTPVFPDGSQAFGDGKAGMYLGLMSIAAYYGNFIPKVNEKDIGVFFPPGANYIPVSPNNMWSIPSFSDNKDAAWEFIKFMTDHESAETFYKVGGLLPNREDVEISANAPAPERAIIEAIRERPTFPIPEHLAPGTVMFTFDMEVNEVLQGRKSLAEAMKAVQSEADKRR